MVQQSGRNGCVYPCADVTALASALTGLLESPDRRAAMGRESRRIGRSLQQRAHGDALLQALDSLGLSTGRFPETDAPASAADSR